MNKLDFCILIHNFKLTLLQKGKKMKVYKSLNELAKDKGINRRTAKRKKDKGRIIEARLKNKRVYVDVKDILNKLTEIKW